MNLWLNGQWWGDYIRGNFSSQIEWIRRSFFEHCLPSFPDPEVEGEKASSEAWEMIMSRPSNGSDDPGDYAEWAQEQGIEAYIWE